MKTKTLFTIIFAALVIFNVSAQNNKVVKRNIDVNSFSAISASSGWDVIIRQGNRQSVSIEVSESILERAVVEVKNGTLHIYNKKSNQVFSWKELRNARDIKQIAYVTVTDLNKISASGGVDIRFKTPLKTTDFDLNMSGGTDLENLSLNCNSFMATFSGAVDGKIRVSNKLKIAVSGESDVVCYGNPADVEKNIGRSGSFKFN